MSDYYKRRTDDEEDTGPIGKRKPRPEPKPERKAYVRKFPMLADGRPALGFATLSHSNLKTWSKVAEAYGHNTRKIEAPNVRKDAPKPIELLEGATGSYVDRAKAVLKAHGVQNVRKNAGGIVTEDIYGASNEYWNRDGDWKLEPVEDIIADPVIQAGVALAKRKHGKRLISISLHLDEESPHIHVVAVPLVEREHARRGPKPRNCELDDDGKPIDPRPKVLKWTLDPSSLRGQSRHLEKNHDEWAEECAPFRLIRGARGSDMSEEERRARRNRQTGRSSMAEKDARERREDLGAEAEADRERAKKLLEEAEAEQAAAEAAKAEAERLHVAQTQLQRELAELRAQAIEEREAAAAEREKAAKATRAAEAHEAELAKAVAEQQAVSAALNSKNDRLTHQIQVLAKIIDPDCPVKVYLKDGQMRMRGHSREDLELLLKLPAPLRTAADKFLELAASVSQQVMDLNVGRRDLEIERQQLQTERNLFEPSAEMLEKMLDRARAFLECWTAIPADARTPQVNAAVSAATGLTAADLPPGYEYPGTGRQSATR